MKNRTTMFSLILILTAMTIVSLMRPAKAESPANAGGPDGAKAAKVAYACPMDPEVVSDTPGKCPKCGMFLEAVPTEKTMYVCPMHPTVVSGKPGKCPKCGMDLDKRAEKITYVYSCPMHSEVQQEKPGKCPKCGMFLVARVAKPVAVKKSVTPVQ